MKRAFGVAMAAVLIAVAVYFLSIGYDRVFVSPDTYYAQVDNARLSKAEDNGNEFDYHYELPAVSEDGDTTELGFDTSRELRESAYLKLETLALRGVVRWEEVTWDEIPAAAQTQLDAPAV